MKRRSFLRNTAAAGLGGALGLQFMGCGMDVPYLDKIGLQLWTVRNQLAADPMGTLQAIKAAGYHQVELQSDAELDTILPMAKDAGLAVNSAHINFSSITGRWDLRGDNPQPVEFETIVSRAKQAGLSDIVCGYIMKGNRETMDDFKRLAEQLNRAGEIANSAGLTLSYHNHSFEFKTLEGYPMAGMQELDYGYQVLVEETDADKLSFEVDIFWVALGGAEPQKWINRLAERCRMLHLKDLNPEIEVPTFDEGATPPEAFQELGDGTVDVIRCMNLGKAFNAAHVFVEQDQSPDPLASIRQSMEYLRGVA